jgi:H+-transporting ATPase
MTLAGEKGRAAAKVQKLVDEAGTHGYRTLGVGVTDENGNWHYVGLISLEDPPRQDSAQTVKSSEAMGVDVKMVTGDHGAIAREIASQVGIGTHILEADALADLPDRKARALVEGSNGFSQVFPEHKYEIVQLLQDGGHIVGMTGDGVNDAPALKKADCGIAVAGATDAAKSAADIVLTLPGLGVIVDAIKESRRIFQRMQSYAIYRISETLDVLLFTVLAILLFHQYPVTAIMIVMLAVFNDFPIMAISYDNVIYENRPDVWKMSRVLTVGSLLGITNVLFTFLVFFIGREFIFSGAANFKYVQTLVFAELAIAGNMTVFLARCRGPLWSIRPGKALVWSSVLSKLFVSCCCAFGWFMAPIGWWVVLIWIFAALQMLITDRMKLFAYKMVEEETIWDRKIQQHHKGRLAARGD